MTFYWITLFFSLLSFNMNPQLEQLEKSAAGLLFMSESDHPFEVIQLPPLSGTIEEEIKGIVKLDLPVETQTLEYFFRNATKEDAEMGEEQRQTAQRFRDLKKVLETELTNVQVYRTGSVEIKVFIIGQLKDGSYGGLTTKLIET
jgi:hypothetical protein